MSTQFSHDYNLRETRSVFCCGTNGGGTGNAEGRLGGISSGCLACGPDGHRLLSAPQAAREQTPSPGSATGRDGRADAKQRGDGRHSCCLCQGRALRRVTRIEIVGADCRPRDDSTKCAGKDLECGDMTCRKNEAIATARRIGADMTAVGGRGSSVAARGQGWPSGPVCDQRVCP
jgi:hypothetical protein